MRINDHELMAPAFETPQGRWDDHRSPVVSIVKSGAPISEGVRLWLNDREWGYVLDDTAEGFGTAPVALQTADLASGGAVFRHARFESSDMFLPIQLHSPVPSALPSMLDRLIEIMQPASGGFFDVVVFDQYGQETRTRSVIYESGLENVIRRSQHWWTVGITGRFVDPFWYGQVRELRRTLGSVDKKFITAKEGHPDSTELAITYEWEGEPHNSPSVKRVNGDIAARNFSLNPTYKENLEGISAIGGEATITHRESIWDRDGVADVNYAPGSSSWESRIRLADFPVPPDGIGKWVAFGVDLRRSSFSNYFGFRVQRRGSSFPEYKWVDAGTGWQRHVYAAEIIPGTTSLVPELYPSESGDPSVRMEGNGRFGVDNLVVAIGDSEADAIAQVETYFDGDSRDVTPQVGGYEFPFFPVRIGGSVVQGEYELQVEGDAPAFWSGVITPPGEDLLIQNAQGERIFVKGRVDEPILIQTRPQEQDITLADGTPIWDRIDPGDDDFFPLHPGRNTVHVSMVGATQQSEILIRYREAFFHSLGGGQ